MPSRRRLLLCLPAGSKEQADQHDGHIPDDHDQSEEAPEKGNLPRPHLTPRLPPNACLPANVHEGQIVREPPRRRPAVRTIMRQRIHRPKTPQTDRYFLTRVPTTPLAPTTSHVPTTPLAPRRLNAHHYALSDSPSVLPDPCHGPRQIFRFPISLPEHFGAGNAYRSPASFLPCSQARAPLHAVRTDSHVSPAMVYCLLRRAVAIQSASLYRCANTR